MTVFFLAISIFIWKTKLVLFTRTSRTVPDIQEVLKMGGLLGVGRRELQTWAGESLCAGGQQGLGGGSVGKCGTGSPRADGSPGQVWDGVEPG